MTFTNLQSLAQVFAERQLNAAAIGIVLAMLLWASLRVFFARQNSGTRFAIWFSTLLAMVALPFLSVLGFPHLRSIAAKSPREIVLAASWASYLFVAWAAGAALLLLRLGVGLWRVREIRRNCRDLDLTELDGLTHDGLAKLDPALAAIVHDSSSRRRVTLCVSDDVAVPAAIGLFRPAIVFPADLLPQLASDEIEMIVRHELAHLRRWDDWTNLAQKIVKAVLFFHPAVWWIENRLTLEREMACDDIVLAQAASPRVYASSLISFAEKLQSARGLALAQALVSRMHQMSLRVAQILDARRPKHTGIWKPAVGLTTALLMFVFGAAPFMPRFVAFEARPSHIPDGGTETAPAVSLRALLAASEKQQQVALRQNSVAPVRAIPATFHPTFDPPASARRSLNSRGLNMSQANLNARQNLKKIEERTPAIMQASAIRDLPVSQRAIYVLQTMEYENPDAAGSTIWTFCVWRVDANNPAQRQLESAIVVGKI
jgi:beta-lactamase regulating signal transducer with metallopeptidase domain